MGSFHRLRRWSLALVLLVGASTVAPAAAAPSRAAPRTKSPGKAVAAEKKTTKPTRSSGKGNPLERKLAARAQAKSPPIGGREVAPRVKPPRVSRQTLEFWARQADGLNKEPESFYRGPEQIVRVPVFTSKHDLSKPYAYQGREDLHLKPGTWMSAGDVLILTRAAGVSASAFSKSSPPLRLSEAELVRIGQQAESQRIAGTPPTLYTGPTRTVQIPMYVSSGDAKRYVGHREITLTTRSSRSAEQAHILIHAAGVPAVWLSQPVPGPIDWGPKTF